MQNMSKKVYRHYWIDPVVADTIREAVGHRKQSEFLNRWAKVGLRLHNMTMHLTDLELADMLHRRLSNTYLGKYDNAP
jgi:hypothetical protein